MSRRLTCALLTLALLHSGCATVGRQASDLPTGAQASSGNSSDGSGDSSQSDSGGNSSDSNSGASSDSGGSSQSDGSSQGESSNSGASSDDSSGSNSGDSSNSGGSSEGSHSGNSSDGSNSGGSSEGSSDGSSGGTGSNGSAGGQGSQSNSGAFLAATAGLATTAGLVGLAIYALTPKTDASVDVAAAQTALLYFRGNAHQLSQDLALGAGPAIDDLAHAAAIAPAHRVRFGKTLRQHRVELLALADPATIDLDRALALLRRIGAIVRADETLKADAERFTRKRLVNAG